MNWQNLWDDLRNTYRYKLWLKEDDNGGFRSFQGNFGGRYEVLNITWLSWLEGTSFMGVGLRDQMVSEIGFTRLEDYVLCKLKFSSNVYVPQK